MKRMGSAFGVPSHAHPPTYADFRSYIDATVSGLAIGEESRRVARSALTPEMPALVAPAGLLGGLASVGLLPPPIRDGLGLWWGPGAGAGFGAMAATLRTTVPLLPARVRFWPHARMAAHRVGAERG
jgi:uncharacterized protein (DUF2236 family)